MYIFDSPEYKTLISVINNNKKEKKKKRVRRKIEKIRISTTMIDR